MKDKNGREPTKAELEDIRLWITDCDLLEPMELGGLEFCLLHFERFLLMANKLLELGHISKSERAEIVEKIVLNIGIVKETQREDLRVNPLDLTLKDIFEGRF